MTMGVRFGITIVQSEPYPVLAERWRYFDELGFDCIWHPDHLLLPPDPTAPLFEAWTLLAAIAAETSRIRMGAMVTSNLLRHPALLAQQAITVDHVSGGRLVLGIGCGWFEEEHRKFGIPLFDPGPRVDRFEESLGIIDRLLRGQEVTFEGRHYRLSGARLRPRPVQSPRPPFMVAAHQPRMLRLTARYADGLNSTGTPAEMARRNRVIDSECERIGRDPTEISRSVYVGPSSRRASSGLSDPWSSVGAFTEAIGRYAEVGMNEFILSQPSPDQYRMVERIASEVVGPV